MSLSKDEINDIATAVHDAWVIDRRSEFFIDPKAHYDQHARIDRILDMYESAESIIGKMLVVFAVVGVLALIVLGFRMKP